MRKRWAIEYSFANLRMPQWRFIGKEIIFKWMRRRRLREGRVGALEWFRMLCPSYSKKRLFLAKYCVNLPMKWSLSSTRLSLDFWIGGIVWSLSSVEYLWYTRVRKEASTFTIGSCSRATWTHMCKSARIFTSTTLWAIYGASTSQSSPETLNRFSIIDTGKRPRRASISVIMRAWLISRVCWSLWSEGTRAAQEVR